MGRKSGTLRRIQHRWLAYGKAVTIKRRLKATIHTCPLCGGTLVYRKRTRKKKRYWHIKCNKCGLDEMIPVKWGKEEKKIDAFNRLMDRLYERYGL